MGVSGVRDLGEHFHHKPLLRREIRILAQLGLRVAPRFLHSAAGAASRRGKSPNLFLKISGLGP